MNTRAATATVPRPAERIWAFDLGEAVCVGNQIRPFKAQANKLQSTA